MHIFSCTLSRMHVPFVFIDKQSRFYLVDNICVIHPFYSHLECIGVHSVDSCEFVHLLSKHDGLYLSYFLLCFLCSFEVFLSHVKQLHFWLEFASFIFSMSMDFNNSKCRALLNLQIWSPLCFCSLFFQDSRFSKLVSD